MSEGSASSRRPPGALEVLVVEDDPESRAVLTELLVHEGMCVRVACSATAALDVLRQARPDLVLTDLALGAERGDRLAARLREDPDTRDLAIVAITGCVDPHWDVVRFFDAYLVKPLDHRTLGCLLRSIAESARARDRARRG